MHENTSKKRILISVTNKKDIEKFAKLIELGWEIVSTGGTADYLRDKGIPCTLIEDITGFPEMMRGRLKTLHPLVFGGILADRDNQEHMDAVAEHAIGLIDIVVVNLYDFAKKPGIANIDIGGPSLLRAAGKNALHTTPVVESTDYDLVIDEIVKDGSVSRETREALTISLFEHTGKYDLAIAKWMREERVAKADFLREIPAAVGAH